MSCEPWREAISAIADGEDPGLDRRLLDAHVVSCAACRSYESDVAATRSPMRMSVATPMPDLARQVVKANAVADRARAWWLVRLTLGVVAVQIIGFALPDFLTSVRGNVAPHTSRELGAFSIAYAVGLLVVVARPARARTLLPVAQVLALAIVLGSAVDIIDGATRYSGEIVHVPQLISVALLWALAVPAPRAPSSSGLRLRRAPASADRDTRADTG